MTMDATLTQILEALYDAHQAIDQLRAEKAQLLDALKKAQAPTG